MPQAYLKVSMEDRRGVLKKPLSPKRLVHVTRALALKLLAYFSSSLGPLVCTTF